jgi:hypothetical protein
MEDVIKYSLLNDADMAKMTRRLLRKGAQVRPEFLESPDLKLPYHKHIKELLKTESAKPLDRLQKKKKLHKMTTRKRLEIDRIRRN